MSTIINKKDMVSLLIESPLYFTLSLSKRYELVTRYGGETSFIEIKNRLINWIETGTYNKPTF